MREIEAAARKAARVLEEQGAIVEEADPPLDANGRHDPRHVVAGDGRRSSMRLRRRAAAKWIRVCARSPNADGASRAGDYIAAYNRARRAAHRHAGLPRALRPAANAGDADHRAQSRGLRCRTSGEFGDDWINWSPYTYPFNLTQQPAASVPCGLAAQRSADGGADRRAAIAPRPCVCCGRRGRSNRRCRCRICRRAKLILK